MLGHPKKGQMMRALLIALMLCAPAAAFAGPLETDALKAINAHRAQAGCPALRLNPALQAAALGHANAMARQDFFSHKGRNGSTMQDRIEAEGYRWRALAENIAAGQKTGADVVATWMASDGHRANILNCTFRETGLAVVYQADDQPIKGKTYPMYYYWVQTFGSQ
jgi:uncharacterized protein YkwD